MGSCSDWLQVHKGPAPPSPSEAIVRYRTGRDGGKVLLFKSLCPEWGSGHLEHGDELPCEPKT